MQKPVQHHAQALVKFQEQENVDTMVLIIVQKHIPTFATPVVQVLIATLVVVHFQAVVHIGNTTRQDHI